MDPRIIDKAGDISEKFSQQGEKSIQVKAMIEVDDHMLCDISFRIPLPPNPKESELSLIEVPSTLIQP